MILISRAFYDGKHGLLNIQIFSEFKHDDNIVNPCNIWSHIASLKQTNRVTKPRHRKYHIRSLHEERSTIDRQTFGVSNCITGPPQSLGNNNYSSPQTATRRAATTSAGESWGLGRAYLARSGESFGRVQPNPNYMIGTAGLLDYTVSAPFDRET
jgi:hypothetical protein